MKIIFKTIQAFFKAIKATVFAARDFEAELKEYEKIPMSMVLLSVDDKSLRRALAELDKENVPYGYRNLIINPYQIDEIEKNEKYVSYRDFMVLDGDLVKPYIGEIYGMKVYVSVESY